MKCETLDVWKKSSTLCSEVYKAFRECKDFGFKDQITRSCLSIPSNIAEGMEKSSSNEQIRFLDISKGSAAEFATQTYIGIEIEYIDRAYGQTWIKEAEQILGMLTKLQYSIRSKNAS